MVLHARSVMPAYWIPQVFVAASDDRAADQELFLFSWRLVLCDVVLGLYLFVISVFILAVGADLTTNVVINVVCRWGGMGGKGRIYWSS
jgi:hypothetical protein